MDINVLDGVYLIFTLLNLVYPKGQTCFTKYEKILMSVSFGIHGMSQIQFTLVNLKNDDLISV